jgi:hypothetical protein
MENKFNVPTEIVELPSKGLLYPKDNPLSSGKIEMRYMTAADEDILTNQSYIQKGTVIDKLMKALIVSDVDYNDLISGDRNAIMIAARVLGYGKDYTFIYNNEEYTIDLSKLENKIVDESKFISGINEFDFTLPATETKITFKFLNNHDEKKITQELEGLKKINKNAAPEASTRLKYVITSVGGERDAKTIREFIDKQLLARDSRALREYIRKLQPDVDVSFYPDGQEQSVDIPFGLSFFWPDA